MQERYSDRQLYFREQSYTTEKYVIPFIEKVHPVSEGMRVLEIGCGEGGNIVPFLERGCRVTGIDINEGQIALAREFYSSHPNADNLTLISEDIYKVTDLPEQFDIVVMRDVIEHIPDQEHFLSFAKQFIAPGGVMFIGFPPWQNPFGGHQQICTNKMLARLPWFHLLPRNIYEMVLRENGVEPTGLLEIKDTGISLERLEKILRKESYLIVQKELYLINPNYEVKFKLHPRKLWKAFHIPYLRNFYTTCGYYLLKQDESTNEL